MRISLFKALSVVFFCFSFALWTDARSMEISTDEEIPSGRSVCRNSGCCRSDDDCSTHYGLKRWVYGIKEYVIDRCLCCTMCGFNHMDEDREWIDEKYGVSTDCPCVALSPSGGGCLHNNPVTGTLCFPLATVMHLICLPVACCHPTKDDSWRYAVERGKEKEEERRKARVEVLLKEGAKRRDGKEYEAYYASTYSTYSPTYSTILTQQDIQSMQIGNMDRAFWNTAYHNPSSPVYVGY